MAYIHQSMTADATLRTIGLRFTGTSVMLPPVMLLFARSTILVRMHMVESLNPFEASSAVTAQARMTQALRRVRNDQHMTLNFEGLQQRIIVWTRRRANSELWTAAQSRASLLYKKASTSARILRDFALRLDVFFSMYEKPRETRLARATYRFV